MLLKVVECVCIERISEDFNENELPRRETFFEIAQSGRIKEYTIKKRQDVCISAKSYRKSIVS